MKDVRVHEFGQNIKTKYVSIDDYVELKEKYQAVINHAILGRAIEYAYENGLKIEFEFGVFFIVIDNHRKGTVKEWYVEQLKKMKIKDEFDI